MTRQPKWINLVHKRLADAIGTLVKGSHGGKCITIEGSKTSNGGKARENQGGQSSLTPSKTKLDHRPAKKLHSLGLNYF
jgi:hypothetical protein